MIAYRVGMLGIRPLRTAAVVIKPFLQRRNRTAYNEYMESRIGNREMVGFGYNGQPFYADLAAFPFPAIRYKEQTPEIMALREKEKGDWRLLSMEEKKTLYRASYCQTFAEFKYISNEWMYIVGVILMSISAAVWFYIWLFVYIYGPYPESFSFESKQAQLKRMIDLHVNPIKGLTSNYDYEKMDWKKKGWFTPKNPYAIEEEEECE